MRPTVRQHLIEVKGKIIQTLNRVRSIESIFSSIYRNRQWGNGGSLSGTGSNLDQTNRLPSILENAIEKYNVRTILDIPCGDFHWMRHVDLSGVKYIGADIVPAIVGKNASRYGSSQRTFLVSNLIRDPLPEVDLIFCRDCLVHLSDRNIFQALGNIKASGSRFLLTTTFPSHANRDIVDGNWRPINLEAEPFSLPSPDAVFNEGYHGKESGVGDKSLALWRIDRLP